MHLTIRPHAHTSAHQAAFTHESRRLDALTDDQRSWMTDAHLSGYAIHVVIEPEDAIGDIVRRVVSAWHARERLHQDEQEAVIATADAGSHGREVGTTADAAAGGIPVAPVPRRM